MCKDAIADNAGHIVDHRFEFEWIRDGESVNIEDDVPVVDYHTSRHGIAPRLLSASRTKVRAMNHLNRQGNLPKVVTILLLSAMQINSLLLPRRSSRV